MVGHDLTIRASADFIMLRVQTPPARRSATTERKRDRPVRIEPFGHGESGRQNHRFCSFSNSRSPAPRSNNLSYFYVLT